ncbi:hypothetical protein EX30DRAFT_341974 [Ascodesmis nigricans]|uniref:Uncharacterized protein n=1 Tax=Ascodesmis nigricans TaxID=341454 RepID=A0A4S2MTP4_9PEZI|nr:hypothetical protein EX30DRAFT_341974 [Ascodesmis nigricans]
MRYFIDLENELVGLVPASISQGPDVAAKQDQLRGLGVDTERAEFYIFAKRAEVVLKREEETVLRCEENETCVMILMAPWDVKGPTASVLSCYDTSTSAMRANAETINLQTGAFETSDGFRGNLYSMSSERIFPQGFKLLPVPSQQSQQSTKAVGGVVLLVLLVRELGVQVSRLG